MADNRVPDIPQGITRELNRAFQGWLNDIKRLLQIALDDIAVLSSNSAEVTLIANAVGTIITADSITAASHFSFTPLTANAAAELGAGTMYVSARAAGSATITHANNAQTDRTFSYSLIG